MNEFSSSKSTHMSDDVRALVSALIAAKKKFSTLKKSGYNGHTKASYSTYSDLRASVDEALNSHDIDLDHYRIALDNGSEILRTRITHAPSGQFKEDECYIHSEKPGNQGIGSAITYMKRYAIMNLCGLRVEDEDDDGELERKHIESASNEYISKEQLLELQMAIKSHPKPRECLDKILGSNKISDLSELKESQFAGAMRSARG